MSRKLEQPVIMRARSIWLAMVICGGLYITIAAVGLLYMIGVFHT
jgi:hypothetical protein